MLTSGKSFTWVIVAAVLAAMVFSVYQVIFGGGVRQVPISIDRQEYQASVFADDSTRARAFDTTTWTLDDANVGLVMFAHEARNTIRMPDVSPPRDFIWLDKDKKIIDMKKEVRPGTDAAQKYTPTENSKYVLILPGGWIDNHSIQSIHTVSFDPIQSNHLGLPL